MKKLTIKKPKAAAPKKAQAAKPKLKKSDPDYFAKIGAISAAKRKLNKEYFSQMAKLSHGAGHRPGGYHGGRKKKVDAENG